MSKAGVGELLLKLREDFANSTKLSTRRRAVLPLLAKLGWDIGNAGEVICDFPTGNGRVDYCLMGRKSIVFLLVRGEEARSDESGSRLLHSGSGCLVEMVVSTNGSRWKFYPASDAGSRSRGEFLTIDLDRQGISTTANLLQLLLVPDAVSGGSEVRRAREVCFGGPSTVEATEEARHAPSPAHHELCQPLLEIVIDQPQAPGRVGPAQRALGNYLARTHGLRGSESVPG